jgi:hypothetical protein
VEKNRNQGTFFKGLYTHKKEEQLKGGRNVDPAATSSSNVTDRESSRSKAEPPDLILVRDARSHLVVGFLPQFESGLYVHISSKGFMMLPTLYPLPSIFTR